MTFIKHPWSQRRPDKIARWYRKGLGALEMGGVLALSCALMNFGGCGRADGTSAAASTRTIASPAAVVTQASTSAPAGAEVPKSSNLQYVSSPQPGEASVMGTSTLHDWTVKSGNIQGNAEFSGDWTAASAEPITLDSVKLSIPVSSLKSTEGSGMDKTMYDALNSKKFPNITYKLTKATLKSPPSKTSSAYHFDTTGMLSIAGNEHPVALDLAVMPGDNKKLTITTDVKMKMTSWGVKPPTAMLGMIKSGDAISVKVSWQLESPSAPRTDK